MARALGVEDRGYLALLLLFPQCIAVLVGAGMPLAVTYYLSGQQLPTRSIIARLQRIVPIQAGVILLLHVIALHFYLRGRSGSVAFAGLLSLPVGPLVLAQEYGSSLLQGQNRFTALNYSRLILPVTYVVLVVALSVADVAALDSLVIAWVCALALSGASTIAAAMVKLPRGNVPVPGAPSVGDIAGFGLRGLLGSASPIETFRLDQLVAGLFVSPAALGLFVVGRAFANIPVFIANSAATIAYPSVARAGPGRAGMRMAWRFFVGVALGNTAIVVTLVLLLPWVLPLVFGEEFHGSIVLGQLLLIATGIYGSYRTLGEAMRGLGLPGISSYAELSIWPWLLTGLPLLTREWGERGLAASTVIGYTIALAVTLVLVRRAKT